jgi:hypothetical protein
LGDWRFSGRIEKLRQVNLKLRQRLKELNGQLEKTIEKANSRKVQKSILNTLN